MIVDRHTAHQIATRQITSHRVPADQQPPRRGRRITIAVHRERAFDPACQVIITACTRSRRVDDPTGPGHQDTLSGGRLEQLGHDTLAAYARAWMRDRDQAWLARRCPPDWFAPATLNAVDHALDVLDDGAVLARWRDRWAGRSVWVVEWEVVDDETVWLAHGGGIRYRRMPDGRVVIDDDDHGLSDRGLTTRTDHALVDAGPYVDPALLAPGWARAAQRRLVEAEDARVRGRRLAWGLR